MRRRIEHTRQSRADLLDIWSYIADYSEVAATHTLERIDRAISTLADQPFMGRARPELGIDIRSFPVGNYLIFYIVDEEQLNLVRVIEGHRDLKAQFSISTDQ
ncbi:MAG: type II toxin-antitoxin system RelE/ParE family toxin [Rhizobiaceae bacterium]